MQRRKKTFEELSRWQKLRRLNDEVSGLIAGERRSNETYDKARKKLTKAEDTDDIATSTDQVIAVQLSLGKRVILTFRPALVMSTIPAGLAVLRKLEEWPSFSGVHIFRATDVCTPLQCLSSVLQ
ncbi:uncharacterized protein LOC144109452 isoform X3 [Amblyomma americanum]